MLGIHECGRAARALHFGNHLQGERRLAGRFWSEHLNHTTAWQPADAECDVQSERTGGHSFDIPNGRCIAETHDRAFAELLLDLYECGSQCLLAILFHACAVRVNFRSANYLTSPAHPEAQKRAERSFLREIFRATQCSKNRTTVYRVLRHPPHSPIDAKQRAMSVQFSFAACRYSIRPASAHSPGNPYASPRSRPHAPQTGKPPGARRLPSRPPHKPR